MPLSSCLYPVRALENRGYLYGVGAHKSLYPTRKISEIGNAIAAGESWAQRMEPRLAQLRDATQETIILGKRQGRFGVIYIAVLEGPRTIRYSSQIGSLKPLHASAIGKAFLMSLEQRSARKLLEKLPLAKVTPTTITDSGILAKELLARANAATRSPWVNTSRTSWGSPRRSRSAQRYSASRSPGRSIGWKLEDRAPCREARENLQHVETTFSQSDRRHLARTEAPRDRPTRRRFGKPDLVYRIANHIYEFSEGTFLPRLSACRGPSGPPGSRE